MKELIAVIAEYYEGIFGFLWEQKTQFLTRRLTMKKSITLLIAVLAVLAIAGGISAGTDYATTGYIGSMSSANDLQAKLDQIMQGQGYGYGYGQGGQAYAEGGNASSESIAVSGDSSADASAVSGDSSSGAIANISTTSISNIKSRTPPLTSYPPYLPYWNHGGWGTLKAYFPTGPSGDGQAYERAFDPGDPADMRELRKVVESLPHDGPLSVLAGMLNGVGALFGGPDNFHHGRGFEIANSLLRDRRPKEKPLLVFVDSNVDRGLLREAGYVYVGKVGIEGVMERNWDQAYDAAVAETLPWDVDILLVSGGMKGVTIGSNTSFPGAAFGYSQVNYSVSLFGGYSSGITEGKGKALVSAEGYRYWPEATFRRGIPKCLYDKIRVRPQAVQQTGQNVPEVSAATAKPGRAPSVTQTAEHVAEPTVKDTSPGIKVSRELFEMAGFQQGQQVQNLTIH